LEAQKPISVSAAEWGVGELGKSGTGQTTNLAVADFSHLRKVCKHQRVKRNDR
jgi:hypothetical protein